MLTEIQSKFANKLYFKVYPFKLNYDSENDRKSWINIIEESFITHNNDIVFDIQNLFESIKKIEIEQESLIIKLFEFYRRISNCFISFEIIKEYALLISYVVSNLRIQRLNEKDIYHASQLINICSFPDEIKLKFSVENRYPFRILNDSKIRLLKHLVFAKQPYSEIEEFGLHLQLESDYEE